MIGKKMHDLALRLWPINRSITGEGVRETLSILKEHIPDLVMHEVPSGTKAFDWIVPREWRVRSAYILTPEGRRICDFSENNLHLVGYSPPVNMEITLNDLQAHLYSLPEQPTAIPYITSYYKEHWGFCLSQLQRESLVDGVYKVCIDSELFEGSLTYGELVLKGESDAEIFISTYICHPSMANNELSGPVVSTFLANWLMTELRRFTYRIVFIPETIGSVVYISKNIEHLKSQVIAGFNITCIGDDRGYSYLPSRGGASISDLVSKHVLKHIAPDFKSYKWGDRGSDERQYCAPGVDLPIASIMRTKYGEYDEYHTSLDDLINVVTPQGLSGGYKALQLAITALENNMYPRVNVLCEPQLGKRGLYPMLSTKESGNQVKLMMDLITWSDGTRSLLDVAELCEVAVWELYPLVEKLVKNNLMDLYSEPINL